MRKAWIKVEPTGYAHHPHQFRIVSESTLFPGKAQPHCMAFGSVTAARDAAVRGGYVLTKEPLDLPLVTAKDRDDYRAAAQVRAEAALNAERGLATVVDGDNVVPLRKPA